jgi:hypothetical protein
MKKVIKISIISSLSFSLPVLSMTFPQKIRIFIFQIMGDIMPYIYIYLILSAILFVSSIIIYILYFILEKKILFKIFIFSIIFSLIQFITIITVTIYILTNSHST